MANEQGVKAVLQLGLSASNLVTFTEDQNGTGDISYTITRNNSPINGGRGSAVVQLGRFQTHDISFSTDDNSAHAPVLRAGNMQRMSFNYMKNGVGTGLQTVTGSAVATVSKTYDIENDMRTYSVTLAIDGLPTEGRQ